MRYLRLLLICLGVVVMTGGALMVAASQIDTEERPAPPQNPGYIQTSIEVPHRDGGDAALSAFLWYPAKSPDAEAQLHAQNALFYGFHAIEDAPSDGAPLPVVLLSHGSGGNGPQLGWLARDLAMRGFIVLAVNHPGTTSRDSDPHRTPHVWERTADLSAALDWLIATPPAGLKADTNHVASVGFSLGGHTALALAGARVSKQAFIDYCDAMPEKLDCGWMNAAGVDFKAIDQSRYEASLHDPRITATVAIDPALPRAMTEQSLAELTAPTLLVSLGGLDTAPEAVNVAPILKALPNATLHETRGAWHFSFIAECSTLGRFIIGRSGEENICADLLARKRADIHDELRGVIGAFLEEALTK